MSNKLAISLFVVIILYMETVFGSNVNEICSDVRTSLVEVEPSPDGVEGRYSVRYCEDMKDVQPGTRVSWMLVVRAVPEPAERCSYNKLGESIKGNSVEHSRIVMELQSNINCSHVCYETNLDLIYEHCYRLYNFIEGKINATPNTTYYYAHNNISGPEYFKAIPIVDGKNPLHQENNHNIVAFSWYTGRVPITNYAVERCINSSDCNNRKDWVDITHNCTVGGPHDSTLTCAIQDECAKLWLKHIAPWDSGLFSDLVHVHSYYCPSTIESAISVRVGWWVWAAGAAGAALAVAVALWVVVGRTNRRRRKKDIENVWRYNRSGVPEGADRGECEWVILLYARDCPAATRVANAVLAMLEHSAPGKVLDLYSGATSACWGGGAAGWVRAGMARGGAARVVLLQTPALAALHRPRLDDRAKLEEPLLSRGVKYRAPHFADTVLQYALRLLTEGSLQGEDYQRYFVVDTEGVSAEAVPGVTQLRRYLLPAAAELLCAHVTKQPLPAPALPAGLRTDLAAAVADLQAYVRDKPDYLSDLLLFH